MLKIENIHTSYDVNGFEERMPSVAVNEAASRLSYSHRFSLFTHSCQ